MLRKDDDMLHFGHNVHVNATVLVFTGGGQALTVLDRGQHNGVGRDGAFHAVHPQRQPQPELKVPQPARFPRRAGAEKDRTEYRAA